jgi:hypothetical protein
MYLPEHEKEDEVFSELYDEVVAQITDGSLGKRVADSYKETIDILNDSDLDDMVKKYISCFIISEVFIFIVDYNELEEYDDLYEESRCEFIEKEVEEYHHDDLITMYLQHDISMERCQQICRILYLMFKRNKNLNWEVVPYLLSMCMWHKKAVVVGYDELYDLFIKKLTAKYK